MACGHSLNRIWLTEAGDDVMTFPKQEIIRIRRDRRSIALENDTWDSVRLVLHVLIVLYFCGAEHMILSD